MVFFVNYYVWPTDTAVFLRKFLPVRLVATTFLGAFVKHLTTVTLQHIRQSFFSCLLGERWGKAPYHVWHFPGSLYR